MKSIIIAKVPGVAKTIVVEDNATMKQALDIFAAETGEATNGYDIRTQDGTTDVNIVPADGTKVYLVAKVKGNL